MKIFIEQSISSRYLRKEEARSFKGHYHLPNMLSNIHISHAPCKRIIAFIIIITAEIFHKKLSEFSKRDTDIYN